MLAEKMLADELFRDCGYFSLVLDLLFREFSSMQEEVQSGLESG